MVWPVTPRATRPASRTATFRPASFRMPAAVMPVIPDPTMATSTPRSPRSGAYEGPGAVAIHSDRDRGGSAAARLRLAFRAPILRMLSFARFLL